MKYPIKSECTVIVKIVFFFGGPKALTGIFYTTIHQNDNAKEC